MTTKVVCGFEIPVYDKRDGAPSAHLQFKTWTEILGCAWNEYKERSCSGWPADSSHEREMRGLLAEAKRRGETVIAVAYHNCAVSIAVRA